MHFEWNGEDNEFFQRTIEFAQKQLNEDLQARLDKGHFSRDLWRACGEFGLLGLCMPEEYCGLQLSCLQTAHIMEAFGYGCRDHGLVFAASAHLFACLTSIDEYADVSLKRDYLPGLCDGTYVAAHAITESEAGSERRQPENPRDTRWWRIHHRRQQAVCIQRFQRRCIYRLRQRPARVGLYGGHGVPGRTQHTWHKLSAVRLANPACSPHHWHPSTSTIAAFLPPTASVKWVRGWKFSATQCAGSAPACWPVFWGQQGAH